MFKTVLLVRHGDYSGVSLSQDGIRASEVLSHRIVGFYGESARNFPIFSSPTTRARQTAEIIAGILKSERIEFCSEIADSDSTKEIQEDSSAFYENKLANGASGDVAIVVTHLPFVEELAEIHGKAFDRRVPNMFVGYASAVVCDAETRSIVPF